MNQQLTSKTNSSHVSETSYSLPENIQLYEHYFERHFLLVKELLRKLSDYRVLLDALKSQNDEIWESQTKHDNQQKLLTYMRECNPSIEEMLNYTSNLVVIGKNYYEQGHKKLTEMSLINQQKEVSVQTQVKKEIERKVLEFDLSSPEEKLWHLAAKCLDKTELVFTSSDINNRIPLKKLITILMYCQDNMPVLDFLTLDLRGYAITEEELEALDSFKVLWLRGLKVDLRKILKLTRSSMQIFGKFLENMKNLEYLEIKFPDSEELVEDDLEDVMAVLKRFKRLCHLHLYFSNCKWVSNDTLFYRRDLKDLKSLTLSVYGCSNVDEDTFKMLDKILNKSPNLQQLELYFGSLSNVLDKGLSSISDSTLSQLKNLEKLMLWFDDAEALSDSAVTKIAYIIFTAREKLKHLNLNFFRCRSLTKTHFGYLLNSIKNAKELSYLQVDFGYCAQISDPMAAQFLKETLELPKIETYCISFEDCNQISTLQIDSLLPHSHLKNLNLNFSNCSRLGNLRTIIDLLNIKSIENILIVLDKCEKISLDDLKAFLSKLKEKMPSFKSAQIHLKELDNLTTEEKQKLIEYYNHALQIFI